MSSAPATEKKTPPSSPDYGGWLGHKIFYLVISIFGVRTAYALLLLVVPYYALLRPSARRSISFYLKRRFPSDGPLRRLARTVGHFHAFGQTLIDQSVAGILGRERVDFEFPDGEKLYNAVRSGRGVVLLTSHVGNWHLATGMMGEFGYSVHFHFQEEGHTRGRHFFDLTDKRGRFKIIPPSGFLGGMVEMTNILQEGGCVAMMGDRAWGGRTSSAKFLGKDALFPVAPYHLAFATGASVFMILPSRTGALSLRIELAELTEGLDPGRFSRDEFMDLLLRKYVSAMESFLERNPRMWFNFFDFWKAEDGQVSARLHNSAA